MRDEPRPVLAMVNNAPTPYRLHVHQRIAREIPEVELWSLFTHEVSNAPWQISSSLEIRPIYFGKGQTSLDQGKLSGQFREWRKGHTIVTWMRHHHVGAVLLAGYNDLGRLHILSRCRKDKIPCFLFGDSNIVGDRTRGAKAVLKNLLVRRAVALAARVCVCGELGRQYFAKYGARADRIFPFPYEPDYTLIEAIGSNDLISIRARYGLAEDRKYFVFSGRLAPEKRVDLLLQAFCRIADERSGWDVLIVGDGPLRQSLLNLVPARLESRIHWTGFIQDSATVWKLYRCADVLVLPSDYEPWGIVVTEAATCLALVCSSAVGAAQELVRNGVNGRVFTRGDVESLASALLETSVPETLGQMKAASPNVLKEWRKHADPVLNLRQALVKERLIA